MNNKNNQAHPRPPPSEAGAASLTAASNCGKMIEQNILEPFPVSKKWFFNIFI